MMKRGITRKESLRNMRTLSAAPPLYPAIIPTIIAMTLETRPAMSDMMSEFLTAKVSFQKISCPMEFVPSM